MALDTKKPVILSEFTGFFVGLIIKPISDDQLQKLFAYSYFYVALYILISAMLFFYHRKRASPVSLKPIYQSTELDHIRDTLTDVVSSLGEANSNIKKLDAKFDKRFDEHDRRFDEHDRRFDEHDRRFDQHDRRFDEHDKRFDKIDKRFDKIEDTLSIIVNHLKR